MKLLIFQYGDFREAFARFGDGGPETYRDQRRSVDFVAALAGEFCVTVVAASGDEHEDELAPRLTSVGITNTDAWNGRVRALLDRLSPDRIICGSPNPHVLRWAARHRVPTLLSFADLFSTQGARDLLRNARLRLAMRRGRFPCLANHSLNASRSAATALRYPKDRIVPWDWSRLEVSTEVKSAPAEIPTVFFAGAMSEPKGVGDCLEAARRLRASGHDVRFAFAGGGDIGHWNRRAEALGISDRVEFLGTISHADVRRRMERHDVVVVPSRHDYPEGLPNTIYEALAARTPLIISDHPAFAGRLSDGVSCCIFPAGDPAALADRIARVLRDRNLYATLSSEAAGAHDALYIGIEWTRLVRLFLDDPENRRGWVQKNSLSALGL